MNQISKYFAKLFYFSSVTLKHTSIISFGYLESSSQVDFGMQTDITSYVLYCGHHVPQLELIIPELRFIS